MWARHVEVKGVFCLGGPNTTTPWSCLYFFCKTAPEFNFNIVNVFYWPQLQGGQWQGPGVIATNISYLLPNHQGRAYIIGPVQLEDTIVQFTRLDYI